MENGQNGQRQPMSYGKRFWHIWGPFIINWGIGIVVSIIAMTVFLGIYAQSHMKELLAIYEDQKAMTDFAYQAVEGLLKYTTELEGVTALIAIPVMLFLYRRDRKREKLLNIVPNKKAPVSKYILVIAIAGTLSIALNNLIIIGNLSEYSIGYEETATAFYSASLPMQIVCLGILAPISEELIFRGLMYRRMREDTGFITTVFYSAVVFGLFHGNMVQMLYGMAMGLMLAYVCEKYGSVLAPIVAHITANILSILATYFNVYSWMVSNILIVGTITVGCATAAAALFLMIQKIDEKPEL